MTLDPISRLRRFNRAVTTEMGALDTSFLGRGRPLGPVRVLNAIGHGMTDVAALRSYLGLDSGLMSRLLRGLEAEGLIATGPHPDDARRRLVTLTGEGETEFAEYEALVNAQAAHVLEGHPHPERLLEAMDYVASALGRARISVQEVDPTDEVARDCMAQYYAELSARFDGGYDVTRARDPEAGDMRRPRGAFFVACSDGMAIGCGALKGSGTGMAEVKRLWVSPSARGLGLATRLMTSIEASARELGITRLRLDSNSALPEAAALYRKLGWHEIDRYNDDPYPDLFFEKSL